VGRTTLRFETAPPRVEPFYHFALLVPGDRFDAAHRWLGARVELLEDSDTGGNIFDFVNWEARASYVLDPAGNILEFIAHRGIGETGVGGGFSSTEIVGFSELGLVTHDKAAVASVLEREANLHVFDGEIDDPRRLVFIGERARTLILSPPGRGWLPTGRPAEIHPVEVVLAGTCDAIVEILGEQRVRTKRPEA
jgi:hypothetical protein